MQRITETPSTCLRKINRDVDVCPAKMSEREGLKDKYKFIMGEAMSGITDKDGQVITYEDSSVQDKTVAQRMRARTSWDGNWNF